MNDNAFLKSRRTGIFKDMSNGTICIPKDLRDNNGLEKNDRVELIPMQEGIYIRKALQKKLWYSESMSEVKRIMPELLITEESSIRRNHSNLVTRKQDS